MRPCCNLLLFFLYFLSFFFFPSSSFFFCHIIEASQWVLFCLLCAVEFKSLVVFCLCSWCEWWFLQWTLQGLLPAARKPCSNVVSSSSCAPSSWPQVFLQTSSQRSDYSQNPYSTQLKYIPLTVNTDVCMRCSDWAFKSHAHKFGLTQKSGCIIMHTSVDCVTEENYDMWKRQIVWKTCNNFSLTAQWSMINGLQTEVKSQIRKVCVFVLSSIIQKYKCRLQCFL